MPLTAGSVVADRYTLERELGRGATATVWLVQDSRTGDHVALKLLHEDLAESSVRGRFAREARRTASLSHPRIVPVLDAGECAASLYFTQPYMPGGTLRERLVRERQLSVEEALHIGRDIAGALAHAHGRGFIHRDVKPENILFAEDEAYLADFGISQAMQASLDETTYSRLVVRGTLPYMSPEQASGIREYDGRSDLFSLGSVLYECLTGVQAFQGGSPDIIMAQIIGADPRPLATLRPEVSSDVAEIIRTCMAKVPGDRFRDASALTSALANPQRRRSGPKPAPPAPRFARPATIIAIIVALAAVLAKPFAALTTPVVALDTTRFVLFPLEGAAHESGGTGVDDQLLRAGFQRGAGITLVPELIVADRLAQGSGAISPDRMDEVARGLGAGRYVRGRVTIVGGRRQATLMLVDPIGPTALFETQVGELPDDPSAAALVWANAVARLMLRTGSLAPDAIVAAGVWSIPALQAFQRGQDALKRWDLTLADSFFSIAQTIEPDDPGTLFWLAQVRAWARRSTTEWAGLAQRAAMSAEGMPAREGRLALALAALGDGRFPEACDRYREMTGQDSTDFAGWFGLGQCQFNDMLVLRDSTHSPTGWRFRASYERSFRAFERALVLLPTIHRGLAREGFDSKGFYMLYAGDSHSGIGEDPRDRFGSRLVLQGDTLVFLPFLYETLAAGGKSATPDGLGRAIDRQRAHFRDMANAWSSAFPRGSEAKEAVALSLELAGVKLALDTLRLARRLALTEEARHALGFVEARLSFRFGFPDDLALLRRARRLMDSLLSPTALMLPRAAEAREALAVVRGRCDVARRLAVARSAVNEFGVPEAIMSASREVLDLVSMRCDPLAEWRHVGELMQRLSDDPAMLSSAGRAHLLRTVASRPVLFLSRRDSALVARLAKDLDDPLVRAARALTERDTARAREALSDFDRMATPGVGMSPDNAFAYARLRADVGDTGRAIEVLDETLRRIRSTEPFYLSEAGNVGALMRIAVWRAQLAAAAGDEVTARRWREAVAVLQEP